MSKFHQDLFRIPTISENIALFRSMLDSHEIKPGEALALSGSIHAELRRVEGRDGSVYAGYARTMALLNYHKPDVLQHVVANWQLPQTGSVISASTTTKSYTDSLFDDTIAMKAPVNKEVFEPDTEQVKEEVEMVDVPGDAGESSESDSDGEEEPGESEEDEPLGAEEPEIQEEAEFESDEIGTGEGESEEAETDELIYEDFSEGESYDESETSMEEDESADYMNETEYENEPMEEEDLPWAEG